MKEITIEIKGLKADEGKVLTNGEAFSDVGGSIYLGVNDKVDNWNEISSEEAEKRKEEIQKKFDDEIKDM